MLKLFNRKKKDNKGFTLVELVIVVAILAILVGLLAPQYTKYVEKSRKAADASNMDELVKVVKVYAADPANDLEVGNYVIEVSATKGTQASVKKDGNTVEVLEKELTNSVPKWQDTNTKSKKWSDDGKSANITATVNVAADGGTSVTYTPAKFQAYMINGVDATPAPANPEPGEKTEEKTE